MKCIIIHEIKYKMQRSEVSNAADESRTKRSENDEHSSIEKNNDYKTNFQNTPVCVIFSSRKNSLDYFNSHIS